ncbi:MAG: SDR family NAD(P)-dependent oxidoreductase [Alphaproteobacteria bacterium]|nr:SDR family NAD(P)-dependent oxidoreductase [Alphaproteobacteria bacterium]
MATAALPDIDLDGRVVIMTGADRGLGRAMSLGLAEKGARLVLASPMVSGLKSVADEIADIAGPGRALVAETDITDPASCENCLRAAVGAFGSLDVLVNNARRLRRDAGRPETAEHRVFWESDPEIYRQTVEVNVTGTFFMSRTVAPYFVEMGYGKIINLTTSVRNFYGERQSPYGVTKAAIDSSTYIWARDLRDRGVTVNALLPGGACDTGDPNRPPAPGRKLLPVDIMNPVLVWLCSARSDGATGWRYNGSLWDAGLDPDAAAAGCREQPSIRGADGIAD